MAVTWQLEKHTRAKHALLKLYLDRWFPILGKYNGRLNYIDGFAGPGMYTGGEKGSPILAIESAKQHLDEGRLSPKVTINFAFVESTAAHANHLRDVLAQMSMPQQFKVEVIDGEFRDHVSEYSIRLSQKKIRWPQHLLSLTHSDSVAYRSA